MKIAKFFSAVLALLGTVLMVGSILLCLVSLNAEPRLMEVPDGAREQAVSMLDAICAGDYETASGLMYGQPDLGAGREPAEEEGALIWDAFVQSISYEFSGEPYATENGIAFNLRMETMDLSAVTARLEERTQAQLQKRVQTADDVAMLYDEDNNFREDVVEEALSVAVQQALSEDAATLSRELTLNLIYRDGQWWVVFDQALLEAISGGVA